jgi:hypothetical protein
MEDSKTLQVVSFAPQLRHLPYFCAEEWVDIQSQFEGDYSGFC